MIPRKMDDFSVGVQSIARRFEEEKDLGAAALLKRLLKARQMVCTSLRAFRRRL